MHAPHIKDAFVSEYLALIAVGATHQEAVAQVAQSNEVEAAQVEAECASN